MSNASLPRARIACRPNPRLYLITDKGPTVLARPNCPSEVRACVTVSSACAQHHPARTRNQEVRSTSLERGRHRLWSVSLSDAKVRHNWPTRVEGQRQQIVLGWHVSGGARARLVLSVADESQRGSRCFSVERVLLDILTICTMCKVYLTRTSCAKAAASSPVESLIHRCATKAGP